MLLVKTYVDSSDIDGLGLFAGEFIPEGVVVRVTNSWLEKMVTPDQFNMLPDIVQEHVNKYAFNDEGGNFHLAFGHEIFINHSTTSALKLDPGTHNHVAIRNIRVGEEITDDYREYSHKDPNRPWLNSQ